MANVYSNGAKMWNILTGVLPRRICHRFLQQNRHSTTTFPSWMWSMAVHFSSMSIADEFIYPNGDKRLKQYLDGLKEQQSEKYHIDEPLMANILQYYEQRLSIVNQYHELNAEMANETDADIVAMASDEKERFCDKLTELDDRIIDQVLLLNEDDDEKDVSSVMLEIQAGVGGQEAMLFARELGEMYENFIKYKRWPYNLLEEDSTGIGGIRSLSLAIEDPYAYAVLKNEAGVHRVQRVPRTEKSGRIHTSTAVVVIVPCADDIQIKINPNDLQIEAKRASGPGGQSINKSESAIRIVHLPTGIAVECQEERTFHKNKQIAMRKLHGRLYQIEFNKQATSQRSMRKSQTGARTRNEKLRTYNYAQNRITDHRLSGGAGTVHNLDEFLAGNEHFDQFITKVNKFIQRQRLNDILDSKVGG